METQAAYIAEGDALQKGSQNGHSADADASRPAGVSEEWVELEAITVSLSYARKRRREGRTVTLKVTPLQGRLFADPDSPGMEYGMALEKLIEHGKQQAEGQG